MYDLPDRYANSPPTYIIEGSVREQAQELPHEILAGHVMLSILLQWCVFLEDFTQFIGAGALQ